MEQYKFDMGIIFRKTKVPASALFYCQFLIIFARLFFKQPGTAKYMLDQPVTNGAWVT